MLFESTEEKTMDFPCETWSHGTNGGALQTDRCSGGVMSDTGNLPIASGRWDSMLDIGPRPSSVWCGVSQGSVVSEFWGKNHPKKSLQVTELRLEYSWVHSLTIFKPDMGLQSFPHCRFISKCLPHCIQKMGSTVEFHWQFVRPSSVRMF